MTIEVWHAIDARLQRLGRDTGPPPTTSSPRFPGDPNPRQTSRTWWGAAVSGNGSPAAHESAAGVPLAIRRRYYTTVQWAPSPDSALLQAVREDHAANRLPWVSFKVSNWASAASGANDSQFDAIIAALESYAKPTWLIIAHEPENDGLLSADWRGMQARFRARMNAYAAANGPLKRLSFGSCLMSYTWNPASGRSPDDWWAGPGVHDWVGIDHYTEASHQIRRTPPWAALTSWLTAKSTPWALPEWGLRKEDPEAVSKMQDFYDAMLDGTNDCVALTYFDSGLNSTGSGWTLTNDYGLLDRFRALMRDPRSLHMSDLGY